MRTLSFLLLPAAVYQALAIVAAGRHLWRRRQRKPASFQPGVSVLKPLRGLDPNIFEAFVSQASQNYPEFELLFGVAEENDPAIPYVQRLQQQFPGVAIRLITGRETFPNGKVGVLANLARHASYPVWVLNDSDIKVTGEYLSEVTGPLRDDSIGVVTCLYRVQAHTLAAAWEALGIATDFMPSTLVAQLVGVREFGLGSTLAFRAADLESAGGFRAFSDYLADDYQLAKRITGSGKRAVLSTYIVETSLGDATWRSSWQHQIRWARTIRASKGRGYAGLPITQAGVWAGIACLAGAGGSAVTLLGLRISAALLSSLLLGSRQSAALSWLAPVWDVYSFAVWLTSYAGREVRWRDRVMTIDRQGRIQSSE